MKTNIRQKWRRLYKNKKLCYEGFTIHRYPFGAGTQFYENGMKYREGVFGYKGLLCGKEYYPNGNVRFEGTFKPWKSYGPNPPEWGKFYSVDGKLEYQGKFRYHVGGVGYPTIIVPKNYGNIECFKSDFHPSVYSAMPLPYIKQAWLRLKKLPHRIYIKLFILWRRMRKVPVVTFTEYSELVKKDYFHGVYTTREIHYFYSDEAQEYIKGQYKRDYESFTAGEIGFDCLTIGCPSATSYCLEWMTE